MLLVLVIILLVVAFGGMPHWGYHHFGWGPSGIVGVILIIVVVYLLLGRG